MTCEQFIKEKLLQYQAGELTPDENGEVNVHLGECPDCSHYLRSYELTLNLAKTGTEDDASVELPGDLLEKIVGSLRGRKPPD